MILEGIGIALGIAGVATSFFGGQDAKEAQQASIAAQQRAEAARKEAMMIDADRRRRQLIREMLIARSTAVQRGANQGANASGSSALPGAFGQISGRTGFGIEGVNAGVRTGTEIFDANQQLLQARLSMADAQSTQQFGQSLTSLGGALMGNAGTIDRVFSGFGSSGLGVTGPSWFGSGPNARSAFYG